MCGRDWSSDVCSSDLRAFTAILVANTKAPHILPHCIPDWKVMSSTLSNTSLKSVARMLMFPVMSSKVVKYAASNSSPICLTNRCIGDGASVIDCRPYSYPAFCSLYPMKSFTKSDVVGFTTIFVGSISVAG